MTARIVSFNPEDPRAERLGPALEALDRGEVVAIPTETFYGLAADAFDGAAVGRVNLLKRKPALAPVLLLLADAEQASLVCDAIPDLFTALAGRFWPGPLTLVVPAGPRVPDEVSGGRRTVAVRVPGLALPRRLARALGRPITGVSANRTGEPPCRTAAEVARVFTEGLAVIADGGPTAGGAPSTIIDLTEATPRVLREGLLPVGSLRPYLNGRERPL